MMVNTLMGVIASSVFIDTGGPPVITSTSGFDLASSAVIDIPYPTGIQSGDLLIVFLVSDVTNGVNIWASNMVSGWSLEGHGGNGTTDCTLSIYSKVADGTETGNWSMDPADSQDIGGIMLRITNVDPVEAISAATQALGSTLNVAATTSTVADSLILTAVSFDGSDANTGSNVPSGYTLVETLQLGSADPTACEVSVAVRTQASAGAVAAHSWGADVSDGYVSFALVVPPS